MKTIPTLLQPQYLSRSSTLVSCLRVQRRDSVVVGLNSSNEILVIDGVTYYPGFQPSDWISASGLDVDNQEMTVFPGTQMLTASELEAGLWDFADFWVFEANYKDVTQGVTPSRRGKTGEAQLKQASWVIEFRGMKQPLQQPLGEVTSKTCRAHLGDARCKVDLTPFTFTLMVDTLAPTNSQVFISSAATQADDYFGEGIVTFTDGANAGYSAKVKSFVAATHTFTLSLPLPFSIGFGDHFTAIAGCRKRHDRTLANLTGVSDCLDKFDNVLNFQGEPHLPGPDGLTALPTATGDQ